MAKKGNLGEESVGQYVARPIIRSDFLLQFEERATPSAVAAAALAKIFQLKFRV